MTTFSTLSEMLLARAASAQRLYFIDSDNDQRSVPFSELVANASGCLHALQAHGLGAGDELVIFTDNNEQFLTAFWAAILGGLVPVPVAVGISDEHRLKLFRILRQLNNPSLFSNDRLLERVRKFAGEQAHADISALLDARGVSGDNLAMDGEGDLHQPAADDLAFIQYSSGSTSDPKGVCLTHRNLCSNTQAIIDGLGLNENERSLSWMPLTHDMGLIGYHVSMITANMNHAIMDTNVFVRRPLLWLQKASELGSTVLCSPNFGYKHYLKVFERKGAGDIDLSKVRLLLNGAEPISVALSDEFLAALAQHGLKPEAMLPVYGLAEATLAVAIPELGKRYAWITVDRHQLRIGERYVELGNDNKSDDAIRLVKHGAIVTGCEVRISDDNDAALPDGYVGHIHLRGPNITAGIFGDADDSAGNYTADGWLRTGDCGAFADGELLITGRHKEIIIVNGQNYLPHDLEEVVAHIDGLDIGKVVACGARPAGSQVEQLVIFILHRKDAESFAALAEQARSVIGQQIGIDVDYVLPVTRIPKTTSGKIQRRMLAEAFLDGEYAAQIAEQQALQGRSTGDSEEDPLVRDILAICAEFSKDKVIGPDDNLFEVGISSLTLTEIMLAIDEQHPGKVDINDLFDYPSVRELAAFLRS